MRTALRPGKASNAADFPSDPKKTHAGKMRFFPNIRLMHTFFVF